MHVYSINVIHFTDQPPAYPSNDKPSDYNHDVFPHKTAKPPSVDISAVPDNTPAAHIPSANNIFSGHNVCFVPCGNSHSC